MTRQTHSGSCFCGAVEIEVTGAPEMMGYCHCASCRQWSASPVNAFTLWKPDSVRVLKGDDKLRTFEKTPNSQRKWCADCGGHVMTGHVNTMGLIDVYSATIPTLKFEAGAHVHYAESVLPIHGDLPKFRDLPAEAGGSGETMAG